MQRAIGRMLAWIGTAVLFAIVALCLVITVVPPFLDQVYYTGPAQPNFDGERFVNPDADQGQWPQFRIRSGGNPAAFMLRYLLRSDGRPEWPEQVPVTPTRPPARIDGDAMLMTWVGHSTVLIQTQGVNILTDPVWSERASPFGWIGPKRVTAPGVAFEDLPRVDLVVISHNHYDHFDIATLQKLYARDRPLIVTGLGNDTILNADGIKAEARNWGASVALNDRVRVHVERVHHWASRWGVDRNRALWVGFTIVTPGGNIFYTGDTGPGDMAWALTAAERGPVRLALIAAGAFRFMAGQDWSGSHIGPYHAVEIFRQTKASYALPVHWGTFRLSWEGYDDAPRLVGVHMACAGYDPAGRSRFTRGVIGRQVEIPPYSPPSPVRAGYVAGQSCPGEAIATRALALRHAPSPQPGRAAAAPAR